VNTHWTDRLSEYVDGELSPAEHTACATHLAECEICRTMLQDLQMVTVAARADRDRDPVTNLWPGILARISSIRLVADGRGPVRRQVSFSLPQLALAASLLIAVTAGVSYLAGGRVTSRPVPQETPIQAMAEPLMPPSADVTPANFADAQFDEAVADLERTLIDQRDALDPRTVVVIERNLAVIDEAIRQARAALDADPANTFLNSHLADARQRKLDLLRRAMTLSSGAGD
jgi:Putative zinc-finger